MGPLTGFLALAFTVFSSFPLIRKLFRDEDVFTVLVISFIFGLSVILLPLYIVGIVVGHGFKITSWIIFLTSIVFLLMKTPSFLRKAPKYAKKMRNMLGVYSGSSLNWAFLVVIVLFVLKYAYFLSIKGIFDWDAIGLYLPFARRIYAVDCIPLTGYDYQPVMAPIGISVLYAWAHSIIGSPFDESFRLFPLLFVVVTMLITYKITADLGSKQMANIAVIVYALLPLHDAALFYASYYPDLCYNTLVLVAFFFMYNYVKKHKVEYCLFGGLALGLSALMKPQTFYLFPATIFIFISFMKNKNLQLTLTYAFSALIGFLFVSLVWPDQSFFLNMPVTVKILTFLFVFTITTLVAISITQFKISRPKRYTPLRVVRDALLFYGTSGAIGSIWYLRNYFLMGSILWSFRFQLSNYQWALEFLSPVMGPSIPEGSIGSFLSLLVLLPFTVFVLGTLWIVPKLIGMIQGVRERSEYLIMVIWMMGYWMGYFWSTFHHFELYYLNPRDLYLFAPFLSIFSAFGITNIANYLTKKHSNALVMYLILSLGVVSLTQSMLIYSYGPVLLRNDFDFFAKSLGSSLEVLAGRTPNYQISLLSSMPNLLLFILLANLLILGPFLLGKLVSNLLKHRIEIRLKGRLPFKALFKKIILFALIFSTIVVPYIGLTYEFGGGDIRSFGENQLKPIYGGLFTEVAPYLEYHAEDGEVILMTEFYGLQYHLHRNVRVIALSVPGNLAALRDVIESNDSAVVLSSLREYGVRYFLLRKGGTRFTEYLSNKSILLDVVHNPRYFRLIDFKHWDLYEFVEGRKSVVIGWKDDSFTSNWTYIEVYSTINASWNFTSDGDILKITVSGKSHVCFRYFGIPPISTDEYPYVAVRVKGTPNVRWLFRLIAEGGTPGYDFPYWWTPSQNWDIFVFDISTTSLKSKVLSPEAYLQAESTDSKPATIYIDFYSIFRYVDVPEQ